MVTYHDDLQADAADPRPTTGQWHRSSYCANGACIEVRPPSRDGDPVDVRDSKLGTGSPILTFDRDTWRAFLDALESDDLTSAR